jgi:dTDP-4-dehydrorhamnose reductase
MKILLTGANGFLCNYLIEQLLSKNIPVIATARDWYKGSITNSLLSFEKMDFTNEDEVIKVFEKTQPTHIIHAGAISKPDDCEKDKPLAKKINIDGTEILLNSAKKYAASFLFVSTDFVFDGEKGMYKEADERKAVNYYGQTKISAEDLVMQYPFTWSIVRTVLVYGKPRSGRDNLITIVKQKLQKGETYNVFDDQVRTPTYVEDLAKAMVTMIEKETKGVMHISGNDILTPYDLAIATARFLQLDETLIKKVTAQTITQPAKRPSKTGFNLNKAQRELGFIPTSFTGGLKKTLT